uniref:LRAT domain-containing protein n=1 Tax=Panagrolaimus davidi TaxID=227884 RepID=A0A914PS17_9BILA
MNWRDFQKHVQFVLGKKSETVYEKHYGETPLGQKFAIVVTYVVWWSVRIILDEDYHDLKLLESINCESEWIVKKKRFKSKSEAFEFASQTHMDYVNGNFENLVRCRIRELPLKNPELSLMPGVIIRRQFISCIYHEGLYLGNSQVAHINPEEGTSKLKYKKNAGARTDSLETFLKDKPAYILVPCFRRRSEKEICDTAISLVGEKYCKGLYDFLKNNCQHFASKCVFGEGVTSDELLILSGVKFSAAVQIGAVATTASLALGPAGFFSVLTAYMVVCAVRSYKTDFIRSKNFKLLKDKTKSDFV